MKFLNKLFLFTFSFIFLTAAAPLMAKETIRIQGSTTVFPIAQEAAKAYMKINGKVDIAIESTGSGNGIKALIDGTTDVANASRFIKSEEAKMAYEKGAIAIPFRIAYDCIIPVVNKSNPLKGLSIEQLQSIYSGKVKNWKELGGNNSPIALFSRDTSSGTFEMWKELVMGEIPVSPAAQLRTSNAEIVKIVQENPDAIGYIGIGYLDVSIKALTVNGITGSEGSAIDGSYPITRPLFMFTRGWPTGEIRKFINYMLEPTQGQRLVKKSGYLPLYLPSSAAPCPGPEPCPACKPCPQADPCPPCAGANNGQAAASSKTGRESFSDMNQRDRVALAQKYLNQLGYNAGTIDGIWGGRTAKAYYMFQRDNGVSPSDSSISYHMIELMEKRAGVSVKGN